MEGCTVVLNAVKTETEIFILVGECRNLLTASSCSFRLVSRLLTRYDAFESSSKFAVVILLLHINSKATKFSLSLVATPLRRLTPN